VASDLAYLLNNQALPSSHSKSQAQIQATLEISYSGYSASFFRGSRNNNSRSNDNNNNRSRQAVSSQPHK
jgi:hypothetical protein